MDEKLVEVRVVKHYWGLTWPTLVVVGIVVLFAIVAVYKLYALAIAAAQ
jgi:hypothetical protein